MIQNEKGLPQLALEQPSISTTQLMADMVSTYVTYNLTTAVQLEQGGSRASQEKHR